MLRKLGIQHYDRDILREMTLPEIREHFAYKPVVPPPPRPSGSKASRKKPRKPRSEFKIEILLKKIIWQIYERIQTGWFPEFVKRRGNSVLSVSVRTRCGGRRRDAAESRPAGR